MHELATPENVTALDRAAELISDERRWWGGGFIPPVEGRFCAMEAVWKYGVLEECELDQQCHETARFLYPMMMNGVIGVNDTLGRIPAKHCIEALAAQLRSELP